MPLLLTSPPLQPKQLLITYWTLQQPQCVNFANPWAIHVPFLYNQLHTLPLLDLRTVTVVRRENYNGWREKRRRPEKIMCPITIVPLASVYNPTFKQDPLPCLTALEMLALDPDYYPPN